MTAPNAALSQANVSRQLNTGATQSGRSMLKIYFLLHSQSNCSSSFLSRE